MAPVWQRQGRGRTRDRSQVRTPAGTSDENASVSWRIYSSPSRSKGNGPGSGEASEDSGGASDDDGEETTAGDRLDASSESEAHPQVVLCLAVRGKQLGAVSYDTGSCKLSLLQDAPISGGRLDNESDMLDDEPNDGVPGEHQSGNGRQTPAQTPASRPEQDLVTRREKAVLVVASWRDTDWRGLLIASSVGATRTFSGNRKL